MNQTTILCSFDDVDLADLAAGRIRAKHPQVRSIDVSRPYYGEPDGEPDFFPVAMDAAMPFAGGAGATGNTGLSTGAAIPLAVDADAGDSERASDYIPRSVTMRITCAPQDRGGIEAQLVNLGALSIRSSNS